MKQGTFSIEHGIPGGEQESGFMNSTLSAHGEALSVSIAVYPNFPSSVDLDDEEAVGAYLRRIFAPLQAEGCDVDIKTGLDIETFDDVSGDQDDSALGDAN